MAALVIAQLPKSQAEFCVLSRSVLVKVSLFLQCDLAQIYQSSLALIHEKMLS